MDEEAVSRPVLRAGAPKDTEACIDIWVEACADRDGQAFDGVARRARPKFADSVA